MLRTTVGPRARPPGLDEVGKKISRLQANAERASVQACSPCSLPGGYRGWPPRSCTVVTRGCTGVVRELHRDLSMHANANKSSPSARDEAEKFLTDILANGPMLQSEIQDAAEGNGIAKRTLE